jgi:hypothetical protein
VTDCRWKSPAQKQQVTAKATKEIPERGIVTLRRDNDNIPVHLGTYRSCTVLFSGLVGSLRFYHPADRLAASGDPPFKKIKHTSIKCPLKVLVASRAP